MDSPFYGKFGLIWPVTQAYYESEKLFFGEALVTLAKRDGTFHITEKMFVKQVGKLLGFPDTDIDEVMATTG